MIAFSAARDRTRTNRGRKYGSPRIRLVDRTSFRLYSRFIELIEFLNTCWLIFTLGMQVFGGYNTCVCRSLVLGRPTDDYYITFGDSDSLQKTFRTQKWWIMGTALGCGPFVVGMVYAVLQWCLQSHLWTSDLRDARSGLARVRLWRELTLLVYKLFRTILIEWPQRLLNMDSNSDRVKARKHSRLLWMPMYREND